MLTLIIVVAVVAGAIYLALNKKPDIEDGSWLVLDLYGEVTEYAPPGDVVSQAMGGEGLVLQDMLDALHKAARDERIAGVIWKLSSAHDAGPAKLEELRAATQAVRDAGKPVYAWGDTYDLRTLFLAAACDSVFMPVERLPRIAGPDQPSRCTCSGRSRSSASSPTSARSASTRPPRR